MDLMMEPSQTVADRRMCDFPIARELHYSKGPREVPPMHFPPTAPPSHVSDLEHSCATPCLMCRPGRFPTHLQCHGHLKIVAAFLNCLLALGHPEMAASRVNLQVAAGIRIQDLTETFLSVWLDQVDGTTAYAANHELGRMLNVRDLPGVR